jgi:hypothetical protein
MENMNTSLILESVTTWVVGELGQCIAYLLQGDGEVIIPTQSRYSAEV